MAADDTFMPIRADGENVGPARGRERRSWFHCGCWWRQGLHRDCRRRGRWGYDRYRRWGRRGNRRQCFRNDRGRPCGLRGYCRLGLVKEMESKPRQETDRDSDCGAGDNDDAGTFRRASHE
ncbi:hypothetical protein MMAN_58190 [Mycobacterium mantenii]|uniref:Uncharacterized protein n=1 Tax=Mycobacterium mantenii TaxID=560555 RepID=A0ABM7K1E5_MYCNT|nr:hypothetical protein MMAN_58190 [Mycobacterium mantenii]